MSDTLLRSKLIRLAAANPELRADLLPLLANRMAAANAGSLDTWVKIYEEQLKLVVQKYPDEYGYGLEAVPVVVKKMAVAFEKGDYNLDGRAIKATCRVLGIKHTRTAINEYLRGSGKTAGCEKLPEGGMRDNCEKKQEEGKENKGKEARTQRKAHGPVAIRQPEVMLYAIDASASAHGQSKFYELKVVPFGTVVDVTRPTVMKEKDFRGRGAGGFTLVKRWGRLTDSGSPARVDGMNEYYDAEADARAAMQDTKHSKMSGGGSARYTDVSRSREYPIGLGGSGFGWGGQQACNYVPELRELTQAVTAMNSAISRTAPSMEGLARKNSDVGRRVSALLGELQGTLGNLESYLNNQMSHCG